MRERFLDWKPLPHQIECINSKKQIRVVTCGNRWGKSTIGVVSCVAEAAGVWPRWFGKKIPPKWPEGIFPTGKRILATGESVDHLKRNIADKLRLYLPRDMLAREPVMKQGLEVHYDFVSGAILDLMTNEQDSRMFEGPPYDFWWPDEPPRKPIWDAVFRGLMENRGRVLLTATPITEQHDWLWDDIITPSYDEESPLFGVVEHFVGETHDACMECHGGVIPHQQLKIFEAMLDEKARESRLKGTPVGRTMRTFDYVTEDDHVVPDFDLPGGWPLIEVIDPSQARGLWVAWFTIDPSEQSYLHHAAHIPDGAPSWIASQINKHRDRYPRLPDKSIMDQRGGMAYTSKESRERWFDSLRNAGISCEPSIDTPMQTIHEWLKVSEVPWQEDGKPRRLPPRLRMCRSVKQMPKGPWWALERFQWDPETPTAKQRKQPGKDWIDLIHYFVSHPGISWKRLTQSQSLQFGEGAGPRLAQTYSANRTRPGRMHQGSRQRISRKWMDLIGTGYSRN